MGSSERDEGSGWIIWECRHMWSQILIHVSFGFDGNDIVSFKVLL
jgi:hypothetical protein